eukprot:TRINITY_DN6446_c0_g5_i1.p1 TRINITY_DN6446_c0_g5~~TRINITY_DN6446_c0_g5_i1.p1  ORF type:complete len:517 (-),score=99.37 TRINITY_DN6446_c0_g5_i1:258-1808(-)
MVSKARDAAVQEMNVPLALTEEGSTATPGSGSTDQRLDPRWSYVPPEMNPRRPWIQWIRVRAFRMFMVLIVVGTIAILVITYFTTKTTEAWKEVVSLASIPVVSVFFTWWHVWLGIKMCFYPVEFVGCCAPVLGWQGIVPRRAHIFAARSCDIMIGTLITTEEVIARITPEAFFSELNPVLSSITASVVETLAVRYFPTVWERCPESVKKELNNKVLEDAPVMFDAVISDLQANINSIVDVKQMAIDILVANKPLMVEMFQKIGEREFTFIQHMAAVMGFFLGVIQMLTWLAIDSDGLDCNGADKNNFRCWGSYVILPGSGLIIGYFTNWLGINLIFRPVHPHLIFNRTVNIQGVFLKRQQQVSKELTAMICKHLVHAKNMVHFVVQRESTMDAIMKIFEQHMEQHIERATKTIAGAASWAPGARAKLDSLRGTLKDEVIKEMLGELPKHEDKIANFMDASFALNETISYRLSHLPPEQFEGMLHPVFQEDEWMVLALGGVLGVAVGTLQAFILGK